MMEERLDIIDNFFHNFFIAKTNLGQINRDLANDLGVTFPAWQVMTAIHFYSSDLCTTSVIAEDLLISRQAVQKQLKILTNEGLILAEPNPQDKRAPCYRLSDKGNSFCDVVIETIYRPWMLSAMDSLPLEDIEAGARVLQHLSKI